MRRFRVLSGVALLFSTALVLAGCSGDDDDDASPVPSTPSVAASASTTPAAALTPSASATAPRTPTRTPAETLARKVAHVLVTAGPGDTWESLAAALGSKATPAELQQANALAAGDLKAGVKVAVPITGANGLVPAEALASALGKGGGTRPTLFVPGPATIDGFTGRIALHSVEIANGDTAGEGYGYRLEFFSTSTSSTKGGALDLEAQIDAPLFTIAAGPFAAKLTSVRPGDRYTWMRNGVDFAVRIDGTGATPEQVVATLEAR